jgi:hypothetical protein
MQRGRLEPFDDAQQQLAALGIQRADRQRSHVGRAH